MADQSKFGWPVVDEYEDDELASDEDNTKKITKAEGSMASKAIKHKKMAQSRNTSASRYNRQPRVPEPVPAREPKANHYPTQMSFPCSQLPITRPLRVPRPCFHCGKMSHLRATCPKLSKPYPLNDVESVDNHLHKCACPEMKISNGGSSVKP